MTRKPKKPRYKPTRAADIELGDIVYIPGMFAGSSVVTAIHTRPTVRLAMIFKSKHGYFGDSLKPTDYILKRVP